MTYSSESNFIIWSIRFFFLIFFFLFSPMTLANSKPYCWIKPYLGFDVGSRHMTWDNDYGNNVFERHPWQFNAYGGLRLNSFFGFELGYELITHKKHYRNIGNVGSEVTVLGLPAPGPLSIRSTVKLSGPHISIVGFYPLKFWNCFELIGSVGVAFLKTTQQIFVFSNGRGFMNPPRVRTYSSKSKLIPRASVGFQYKFTDNLGLRIILLGIENTSLFNHLKPAEGGDTLVKMRHNIYHSVGVIFTF